MAKQPSSPDPFKPKPFTYVLGDEGNYDPLRKEQKQASQPDLNYFAFEVYTRQLIDKLVKPVIQKQIDDRGKVDQQEQEVARLKERCYQLELVFDQNQGRNKVFDYIDERLNSHIIKTKHEFASLQEQMTLHKQSLEEITMANHSMDLAFKDTLVKVDSFNEQLAELRTFTADQKLHLMK